MKTILILGATSAIAEQFARLYADKDHRLILVGRDASRLREMGEDLKTRGATSIDIRIQDFSDLDAIEGLVQAINQDVPTLDILFIAYGTLPDQHSCEDSLAATRQALEVNYLGVAMFLAGFADKFQQQGRGSIIVISSVAGDRGRQSNYIYGSAKGGLSVYLSGLRNRMADYGVQVLTVKPGFVDTPMTKDFQKGRLWATPDKVAMDIHTAIVRGSNVLYTPWFWRWIMLIIRMIPEFIFKRLKL